MAVPTVQQHDRTSWADDAQHHGVVGPLPARLSISLFDGTNDNQPKPQTLAWTDLVALLMTHDIRDKKNGAGWSPACYPPGATRANANVETITAFVADLDGVEDWEALQQRLDALGLAYIVHSTHSFVGGLSPSWKLRIIILFTDPIIRTGWARLWRAINELVFLDGCDPTASDPSRLYFLPSHPEGESSVARYYPGLALDPWKVPLPPRLKRKPPNARTTARDHVVGVRKGHRALAVMKMASSLRGRGEPVEVAESLALELATNCSPPLPEHEALGIVRRVYRLYQPNTACQAALSPERLAILDVLSKWPNHLLKPSRVAHLLNRSRHPVKKLIGQMYRDRQIERGDGGYRLPEMGGHAAKR